MQKTFSERTFEDFCSGRGIDFQRVEEEATKTPDYEITCGGVRIAVEVKETAPNKAEPASDRLLSERGYGSVLSHTPGERVRKMIADASPQIKARTAGLRPSLLVVFDRGRVAGHVDAYNIRVAMYGLEQLHITLPPIGTGSPYATGMGHGPRRKMTGDHNTSISAIGSMCMTGPDEIHLHVYHNHFARTPLLPSLLHGYHVPQFELGEPFGGAASSWHEIVTFTQKSGP
jgi:hypothetical protein